MFDPIWECKDGRRMRVGEMHIDHVRACIRLIESRMRWRKHWLPRLYLELEIRKLGGSSGS